MAAAQAAIITNSQEFRGNATAGQKRMPSREACHEYS
jgi:hypothetical protein